MRQTLVAFFVFASAACTGDDPNGPPPPTCTAGTFECGCDAGACVDPYICGVSNTCVVPPVITSDSDLLFVIDNSGSMKEEQGNLMRNFSAFLTELDASTNDFRIGIVTTDVFGPNDSGRLRMVRASAGALTSASCNIGPDTSGNRWLERSSADPSSQQYTDEMCRLLEDFKATVANLEPIDANSDGCILFSDDTIGDGREAGMKAAALALSDAGALAYNGSFIRPEADLVLVFVTDESDCSFYQYPSESATTNAWCYDQIHNAMPVDDYLAQYASIKPRGGEREVRAALIGGGVMEGPDIPEFVVKGCRLDTIAGAASDDCGCWSSTGSDFPCELLNGLGHPCAASSPCVSTGSCDNEFVNCASVSGGSCDTPRCEAMPALRYHEFIFALGDARAEVGFPRGTVEASICQPEYADTLAEIARELVFRD